VRHPLEDDRHVVVDEGEPGGVCVPDSLSKMSRISDSSMSVKLDLVTRHFRDQCRLGEPELVAHDLDGYVQSLRRFSDFLPMTQDRTGLHAHRRDASASPSASPLASPTRLSLS